MVAQPALSDALRNRRSWRSVALSLVWTALFLGLLVAFFSHERPELSRLIHLIRRAQTSWLLVAVALEGVILLAMALVYRSVLARLRHHVPVSLLLSLVLQRQAIATVVPAGGAAGSAVLVRDLQKRAVPVADAVLAAALFSVLGHVSFAIFLAPVLIMLGMEGRVPGIAWLGAALLGLLVMALLGMLWTLLRPGNPSPWVERRLPERLRHDIAALRQHELRPAELAAALGWSLLVDVLGAVMLFACLRAIGAPATAAIAAGGYAVGTLFLMLAPVFQGIGIVELSMTVALQRLGV
ncbi:MAG: hypothetical protein C4346_07715, partial [Chloroflexota bacterium]